MAFAIAVKETIQTAAPIEVTFATVAESGSYGQWAACRDAVLERDGIPDPNGLGAIRVLRLDDAVAGLIEIKEEINHYWPPYLFGYRVVAGSPLKDHQGVATFVARDGGTEVAWHVTGNPRNPEAATRTQKLLIKELRRFLGDLASEAERRATMRPSAALGRSVR